MLRDHFRSAAGYRSWDLQTAELAGLSLGVGFRV